MKKQLLLLFALLLPMITLAASEPYAVRSDDGKTVVFYYDENKTSRGEININSSYSRTRYGTAKTAVFDASFADYRPTCTAYWFYQCIYLTSIIGIEKLHTDNVTDMGGMFWKCFRLTSLDLNGFKTDNVTNMSDMFEYCSNLKTIYVGSGWSTENVTKGNSMFNNCKSLVGGKGTDYDTSHTDHEYARIDGGAALPGYFTQEVEKPDAPGDLNGDGSVDVGDIMAIINIMAQ